MSYFKFLSSNYSWLVYIQVQLNFVYQPYILIALARFSNTLLNRMLRVYIPAFFLILENTEPFIIEYDVNCQFSSGWGSSSSIFNHEKSIEFCHVLFLHLFKWLCVWFFFSFIPIWLIALIFRSQVSVAFPG